VVFVIFDADGNYSNIIVMEENDPLPPGFTKQEVPPGNTWNGTAVVPISPSKTE
jgi:hypothetical protein